jgi:hypothetical protein
MKSLDRSNVLNSEKIETKVKTTFQTAAEIRGKIELLTLVHSASTRRIHAEGITSSIVHKVFVLRSTWSIIPKNSTFTAFDQSIDHPINGLACDTLTNWQTDLLYMGLRSIWSEASRPTEDTISDPQYMPHCTAAPKICVAQVCGTWVARRPSEQLINNAQVNGAPDSGTET